MLIIQTAMKLYVILIIMKGQVRDNAYVVVIFGDWRALSNSMQASSSITFSVGHGVLESTFSAF